MFISISNKIESFHRRYLC